MIINKFIKILAKYLSEEKNELPKKESIDIVHNIKGDEFEFINSNYETYGELALKPKLPVQFIRKDGSQNYKAYFLQSKNNVDFEAYYKYLDDEAIQCKEVICSIARFGEYGIHIKTETTEKTVRRYVIDYIIKFEYNIDFYKYLIDLHPYYINGIHSNLLANEKFIYEIEEHIIHSNHMSYDIKKFYLEMIDRLVKQNNKNGEVVSKTRLQAKIDGQKKNR